MQEGADSRGVRLDAGHVRGGREAADPERTRRVARELAFEVTQVDAAVLVLVDHDDLGNRLAPRQLVRVVLVGTDEDDRTLARRDARLQGVAVVEVRGQAEVHHGPSTCGSPRRTRAAEDDRVLIVGPDGPTDDPPRLLAQARRLQAGG